MFWSVGGVLAEAAVEVEFVVDLHRRKEERDRGARERVVRPDVRGAEERARRGGGGDDEPVTVAPTLPAVL